MVFKFSKTFIHSHLIISTLLFSIFSLLLFHVYKICITYTSNSYSFCMKFSRFLGIFKRKLKRIFDIFKYFILVTFWYWNIGYSDMLRSNYFIHRSFFFWVFLRLNLFIRLIFNLFITNNIWFASFLLYFHRIDFLFRLYFLRRSFFDWRNRSYIIFNRFSLYFLFFQGLISQRHLFLSLNRLRRFFFKLFKILINLWFFWKFFLERGVTILFFYCSRFSSFVLILVKFFTKSAMIIKEIIWAKLIELRLNKFIEVILLRETI
jgi:hypothetical protein